MKNLREEAQKILNNKLQDISFEEYNNNVTKLLEELAISQIELDMQNQELREAQLIIEMERMRFADLFFNAPVGYFQFNQKGIILDFNNKACEILSTPQNILKNKPFSAFVEKGYTTDFYTHLNQVYENTQNDEIELELGIRNSLNQQRFIKLKSNLMIDKIFNNQYCRTIVEDITDKKIAQEKIAQLSNRIEASMIAGNMAWWELELPSGNIVFNQNKTSMLGYKQEDFKHYTDFTKLVHPDDYEKMMNSFKNHVYGNSEIYDIEYRIKNIHNKYLWFRDVGKVVYKQNDIIKLTGIVTNITTSKESNEILKFSEEKFRLFVENLPIGIIMLNSESQIIEWNNAMENITGIHKNEIENKYFWDISKRLAPNKDIENQLMLYLKQELPKALNNEKVNWLNKIVTNTYSNANKELKNVEANHFLIPSLNGNRLGAIIQDVTERLKTEKTIKESQEKLFESNASKDKFFSIIAHDLKNPFSSIWGFSDLLIQNIDKYDKEKIIRFVNNIKSSAENTYKLLENLLEWARSQTGQIEFEPTELNIYNIVKETINLTENLSATKSINVNFDIDKKLTILADKNMISTVLRNLITNSIKYTNRNGYINIAVEQLENNIKISVTDNGVGISAQTMEKLFKITNKESLPGTEKEQGTGLGLILCKEFVEKHNGKISVESVLGKGSTFWFVLPNLQN